jgi:hypothetical protein
MLLAGAREERQGSGGGDALGFGGARADGAAGGRSPVQEVCWGVEHAVVLVAASPSQVRYSFFYRCRYDIAYFTVNAAKFAIS